MPGRLEPLVTLPENGELGLDTGMTATRSYAGRFLIKR